MHDRQKIYFRAIAYDHSIENVVVPKPPKEGIFPHGDRVELLLRKAGGNTYYIAAGPANHHYAKPRITLPWQVESTMDEKAWMTTIAIPLEGLQWEPEDSVINARLGRVYRLAGEERIESSHSGVSIYNRHQSFWLNLVLE